MKLTGDRGECEKSLALDESAVTVFPRDLSSPRTLDCHRARERARRVNARFLESQTGGPYMSGIYIK